MLMEYGVHSSLQIWRGMRHVWASNTKDAMPEVEAATEATADFVRNVLDPTD